MIESSFIFISEKAFEMDAWWERGSLIKHPFSLPPRVEQEKQN
jgi:hypothetical protein